jgi:hypothetical protein
MPKTEQKRDAAIQARIPKELKEKVVKFNNSREYKYLSESSIVCMALEEYIDKHEMEIKSKK